MKKDAEVKIKEKIEKVGTRLKDWDININCGIITGYNPAFLIDSEKRDDILNLCASEVERSSTEKLIKPVLRRRDIKKYEAKGEMWLIGTFPALNIDINK